jgi:chromosome segregation ATPase
MAQVIEQSNFAYEQRDKSRMEILAIDQTNKKEQEIFDRQMDDMGKKLEEEINAAAERRKSQQPKDIISEEESKAAAEKAAKASALLKEKQTTARQRREKIQHFEEAFRKIATATGVSDVDELVNNFTVNDEQNFSLFTYANEQSSEIENIEDQIQTLQREQSSYTNSEEDTSQYQGTLKEFEMKIEAAKSQADKYEQKSLESQVTLDSLQDGIKVRRTF